jgi:hypothetical protein
VDSTDLLDLDSSFHITGNTGQKSSQHYSLVNTRGQKYDCSLQAENNVLTSATDGCTETITPNRWRLFIPNKTRTFVLKYLVVIQAQKSGGSKGSGSDLTDTIRCEIQGATGNGTPWLWHKLNSTRVNAGIAWRECCWGIGWRRLLREGMMPGKDRLTRVAVRIGKAVGKADRKAHQVAAAGLVAKKELEAIAKQVEGLKKQLLRTTKRLKVALR